MEVLVLGLGNVLCGDDGLGVVAAQELLRRYELPDGVVVLDGGTLGLSLLPHLEDARRVLLLDAIRADAAPGSFVRLEGDEVAPAAAARLSPHQVGVADLLDALQLLGRWPERLVLLGLVPEDMGLRFGLSAAVTGRLDELCSRAAEELALLGYPLTPRVHHETAAAGPARPLPLPGVV
jgi:hydrogenase maturation protease